MNFALDLARVLGAAAGAALVWWLGLWAIPVFAAHTVITLVLYAAIMHLKAARDAGKWNAELRTFGNFLLCAGLLSDLTYNLLWSIFVFLWPAENWLFTGTLIAHKYDTQGWRGRLATYICENWLDPLDPSGCHCRK